MYNVYCLITLVFEKLNTEENWVRSWVSPCRICGQSGIKTGFSWNVGFFPASIFLSKLHTHHHHHHHHLNINNIRRTNGTLKSNALSETAKHWIEKYIHFNPKYGDRIFFRNVAKIHFHIKSNPRNKFSNQSE